MKIINIIGGLGNQMFQYAFYLAIKDKYHKEKIKISTLAFNGYGKHNNYELDDIFGVYAEKATIKDLYAIAYPYIHYKLWQIGFHMLPYRKTMFKEKVFGRYYYEVFNIHKDCFFDGYWQNAQYFNSIREKILKVFAMKMIDNHNINIAQKLDSTNSVSIHVRRGDFSDNPIYNGICELDYYQKAIDIIRKNALIDKFYIFSNNTEWCRKHLVPLLGYIDYTIIDWNRGRDSYKDMFLMSKCKHNIIANSTFSWWGAWLNQHPDKIVIGPNQWINIENNEFTLPAEWIKI